MSPLLLPQKVEGKVDFTLRLETLVFDVRKNIIKKNLLTNEVSYSLQKHWQLDGHGGVIVSKHRIYEIEIQNILVSGPPATFFHSLVKNPFVSQCLHKVPSALTQVSGDILKQLVGEKTLFRSW